MPQYPRHPNSLVQLLREAQERHGWLPRPLLADLARELGLTLAQVEGVASFYRFFHLQPVGHWRVLFSDNITDRLLGSEALMADLCQRLRVKPGEVRADGRVSVAATSCTGLCDQGPALLINHHHVITRLDAQRVARLAELIESDTRASLWPAEWFRIDDNVRRADVLLGQPIAAGQALTAALARGPAAMLEEMGRQRLAGIGVMAAEAAATGQLAVSEEECRDVVWSMTDGTLWHRLVQERGWTNERFAEWLGRMWADLLVRR